MWCNLLYYTYKQQPKGVIKMKELYIVDYWNGEDFEQYGHSTYDRYEAEDMFKEAVHAYCLDDEFDGIAYVAGNLVLRTIELPRNVNKSFTQKVCTFISKFIKLLS